MRIDVVSDMVCPWCYPGKRRLETALARGPDIRAEVHWLPFVIVARRLALSGAQEPAAFERAFAKLAPQPGGKG